MNITASQPQHVRLVYFDKYTKAGSVKPIYGKLPDVVTHQGAVFVFNRIYLDCKGGPTIYIYHQATVEEAVIIT